MTPTTGEPGVVELDRAEGRALVERQARDLVGMSLEEFIRAYDSGELDIACSRSRCCFPLPGRTPEAARDAFLAPLRRALSCITDAQLYVPGGRPPSHPEALVLSEDPLALPSNVVPGGLTLRLRHQYRLVHPDADTLWRVTTLAYQYRLDRGDSGADLLSWHWHPRADRIDRPHLHLNAPPITRRVHIPAGRVSIESILRLLLTELGVPPTRNHSDDCVEVLDASEQTFTQHRRWPS